MNGLLRPFNMVDNAVAAVGLEYHRCRVLLIFKPVEAPAICDLQPPLLTELVLVDQPSCLPNLLARFGCDLTDPGSQVHQPVAVALLIEHGRGRGSWTRGARSVGTVGRGL